MDCPTFADVPAFVRSLRILSTEPLRCSFSGSGASPQQDQAQQRHGFQQHAIARHVGDVVFQHLQPAYVLVRAGEQADAVLQVYGA